ncbi:uncharacterized protein LOC116021257 isoform X2 [Ipomoea triloba]|uniref:uncharacterized protein LOC116021257 isoform X2 n=1 Tax=Ipomoea triloba TaxID=35885 RepID=UPI00125E54D0|nr:uncharacterized protein LOC116021257 isoform X2 [Ipomoea triloba]
MIEPKIPRAEQLKNWAKEHCDTLNALKRLRDYNNATINLANPEKEEISKIATVPALINPAQPAWVKGKISINIDNKNTWYIGCSHCLKKVYAESDELFNCMHCVEKTAVGTPRCKMDVEIVDETGHIVASVFGLPAETLLLRSSKQVMELEQEALRCGEEGLILMAMLIAGFRASFVQVYLFHSFDRHYGP